MFKSNSNEKRRSIIRQPDPQIKIEILPILLDINTCKRVEQFIVAKLKDIEGGGQQLQLSGGQ